MHSANGQKKFDTKPISFEVFHFFYTSHLPFFLMTKGHNRRNCHGLSDLILGTLDLKLSTVFTIDDVRTQFKSMSTKILDFWSKYVKPLSDFLHDTGAYKDEYAKYFCNPINAINFSTVCLESGKPLNVQTFRNYFTQSPGYWFHFKYITMAKIEMDCKLYSQQFQIAAVNQVWAQWYNFLCQNIQRLGMDPRAAGMRSRFQLDQSPPLHLTAAILRSLTPGRWCVRLG